jgi:hypothetical protein
MVSDITDLTVSKVPAPRWGRRKVLKRLGLEANARWEIASVKVKEKIIMARRNEDYDDAQMWSEVKAFLKRTLYRSCSGCGKAIKPCSLKCNMCSTQN